MYFFYTLAFVFTVVGAVFWIKSPRITWQEWLLSSVVAFGLAGTFHLISYFGRTADLEMWRGEVVKIVYYPKWVEEYQQSHTETYACGSDSDGRTKYCTRTYYTTEYRTHYPYWQAETNIEKNFNIKKEKYENLAQIMGGKQVSERIYKSGFYSGDRNIYYYKNLSENIIPVNSVKRWSNRLKASPSIYSFAKVSKDQENLLFPWPNGENHFDSGTLLGQSGGIDLFSWDVLASKVGPEKQANIIFVGFPSGSSSDLGQWQQALWAGGKKNDIVIAAALNGEKAEWAFSFGWSENSQVFAELDSIVSTNPINNEILPKIEKAIIENYERKSWKDFDYISVEPPSWAFWVYPLFMVVFQVLIFIWAYRNDENENSSSFRS